MRLVALTLALFGLFILYGFFLFEPVPFESVSTNEPHKEVVFSGFVSNERVVSPDFRLLTINNVSVACSCVSSYLHKTVSLVGLTDTYRGSPQIRVLSITVLN